MHLTIQNKQRKQNMDRRSEQTFLQTKHTGCQEACEKILNTWIIKEKQIKTTKRYYLTLVKMAIIKKPTNNKCWRGCQFISVQSLSHVRLFANPWTATRQNSLSITNYQRLLKLMSIESVMPSNHLILCYSLLLLYSIFPIIRAFSNESTLRKRWPNIGVSASTSVLPMKTLKSLLQHHSSKESILRCSAFFIVQLLYPYRTTGKTIALTRWTFVGKVMSLFLFIYLFLLVGG